MASDGEDALEGVEFVSEQERANFAEAFLGQQVIDFLRSPVGRYLHGRAKLKYDQARDELMRCNLATPWGRRKARRFQEEAARAECFMTWLAEAIQNGQNAEAMLEGERDGW